MTNILNAFKKYFSLFSYFLQLNSLISSFKEAAFNLPIYMKSYSLKDRNCLE